MNDDASGRVIAQRYRLVRRIGRGGMASVYEARHVLIDRPCAVKMLTAELARDPSHKERFLQEARAVNRLLHPNIVEITDYGEHEGCVYLVMEFVPGPPLHVLLAEHRFDARRAVALGMQVASALGRAHQMGVIHRDLKPGNLLVVAEPDGSDLVKLTDFGIARVLDAPRLTASTVALGTPGYVAPEYGEYGFLDARSDLFSLGVVLYEAVAGRLPFPSDRPWPSPGEAFEPTPMPGAPRPFEEVVRTLLARDPDDRPRDGYEAFELLRRVERALRPTTPHATTLPPPPLPSRRGPHLVTAPHDRLAPVCRRALARLEVAEATAPDRSENARAALQLARGKVALVESLSTLVRRDAEQVASMEEKGRAVRGELGRAVDDAGRELSRMLGWAGTLAERTADVRVRRSSGTQPIAAQDVMVWEEAALEALEDKARARVDELRQRMLALKGDLERRNEVLERDLRMATATLEGHVAALRALALETWIDLGAAADALETSLEGIAP